MTTVADSPVVVPLVGQSAALAELREAIAHAARSESKVLITGETGVGKEVVAHQIWAASWRAGQPLVTVNCGGLAETLLESELFGHTKGSFTGAYRDKLGKLELAHTGTVFLDEIGEMSPRMQGLLLRFLETGEIQKVGATDQVARVDARLIVATNRSLRQEVAEGRFRKDLFYRLNVLHVIVPPLRSRKGDIPALVEQICTRLRSAAAQDVSVSRDAMAALVDYPWPGNVRELLNVLERTVAQGVHLVTLENLPAEIRQQNGLSRPRVERRRTIADKLYGRLIDEGKPFWTAVHPVFMAREMTRDDMRQLIRRGLKDSRGSYRVLTRMFNMDASDYKKFLNFLRKNDCQLDFKEFRRES